MIKTIATDGKVEEFIQEVLWIKYAATAVISVLALKYKAQIKSKDGFLESIFSKKGKNQGSIVPPVKIA